MTMTPMPPRGGAGNSGADDGKVTPMQNTALRAFGWVLIYVALVPPITILLYKIAFWYPGD